MATLSLFGHKDIVALPIFVSANMATLSLFGDMTEVTGVPFIAAFYNSHCPITIIIIIVLSLLVT